MADETKTGGEASSATAESDASSLESYLSSHEPLSWKECLVQLHDICFELEKASVDNPRIGELTIRSFIVKKSDTGDGISIELPEGFTSTASADDKHTPKEGAFSFPDEAYMSPEKCLDKPVDRRSDVYGLGCVMYHILTGSPPFIHRDKDKLKEAQAIDYALPVGRRSQRQFIPDEVDVLVAKCLEKDPARRFKHAGDLRANIGKALQLDDDPETAIQKSARFAEFFQKKRKVFYIVLGLVVFAGTLAWQTLSTTSSDDFHRLIERTTARHRNHWFLNLEHGPMFLQQAEFENGKMEPDKDKDPITLKMKDEDVMIFATTKRKTVKDAVEEAVKRKLILFKVDLIGADLKGVTMPGANIEHAFFMEANLDGAVLSSCHMKEAVFILASMKGAKLDSVSAERAVFHKANLEGANLSTASLLDCDFGEANLKDVNFTNSYFLNANFVGADLTGAKFDGATMTEDTAKLANLTAEQKAKVKIIVGPKVEHRTIRSMDEQVAPTPQDNPFFKPLNSNGSPFGPGVPADEPIGLNIPLDKNGQPLPTNTELRRRTPGQPPVAPPPQSNDTQSVPPAGKSTSAQTK